MILLRLKFLSQSQFHDTLNYGSPLEETHSQPRNREVCHEFDCWWKQKLATSRENKKVFSVGRQIQV